MSYPNAYLRDFVPVFGQNFKRETHSAGKTAYGNHRRGIRGKMYL